MTLLRGARLVLPDGVAEDGWLRVDDAGQGRISAIGTAAPGGPAPQAERGEQTVDVDGAFVVPGFVDMHSHGGGGAAYSSGDPKQAAAAAAFHREHGTTTAIASTVSTEISMLERYIGDLTGLVEDGVLAGIHLEGPFISKARCGAHDPALLRAPEPAVIRRLVAAGRGSLKMVTLAPELEYGVEACGVLSEAGVIAAVGHTDATYVEASAAIERGARVATHLFNAMRPVHHREPGPVTAALEHDHVIVETIPDGVHLHPAVIRLAFDAAGAHRVALITDAMSAAGLGDGVYKLGELDVRVTDGVARLAKGDSIAGSTLTMDSAFRFVVKTVGIPIEQAAVSASLTPARALGLDGEIGSIEVGKRGDLVVLDDELKVTSVMASGVWVSGIPVSAEPL